MDASKQDWRPVGAVAPTGLTDARLQCHYAVQWLARVGRAYVPPESDDSHTSLAFEAATGILATQPFAGDMRLGLDIGALRLVASRNGTDFSALDLDGCTDVQAGAWVAGLARDEGLEPDALQAPSPWDMPVHGLASGAAYKRGPGMSELAGWFHNTNTILSDVRRTYASLAPGPSAVRCWPHHFDMAVLLQLEDGNPEQARSVGAGMSPGDGTYGEPYFYVSPWPYPEQNVLPALKGKGFWHTEGFTAAVLTAKTILEHADRPQTIHTFVLGTLESLIEIMRTQGKSRDAK